MLNPFDVTKAVDFTDQEIEETYVEFLSKGDQRLADPASATSQFLVGGKGGGRTHLMRHMAYSLQRLRGPQAWQQIMTEGYLGVYLRASGLNGTRFAGRGVSKDVWESAFAFYMDVTLVEQLALALSDLNLRTEEWREVDFGSARSVLEEVQGPPPSTSTRGASIEDCAAAATSLRKRLDRSVNEAAFTRSFNLVSSLPPGELIFQFAEALPLPRELRITFLVDEFENFTADQQRYVNTLLREKRLPVTFLVGSRIFGIRTQNTLSSAEPNRRGAEFNWIELEDVYKASRREYEKFCVRLVTQRLDYETGDSWDEASLTRVLAAPDRSGFASAMARKTVADVAAVDRPHLRHLRTLLETHSGVTSAADRAIAAVRSEEEPLIEKLAIHKFYQEWNKAGAVVESAFVAATDLRAQLLSESPDKTARDFLKHWRADMLAQLQRSTGSRIEYAGIYDLIKLSGYVPRNLFVVLKNVVREASFQGTPAFQKGVAIDVNIQNRAVVESARWFAQDSLPDDDLRESVELATRRLGKLFERFRYSDKPSEVEVACFSSDLRGISPFARRVLEESVLRGLLIEHKVGRSARNSGGSFRVFQLHPLLAALNGISLVKRGELALKSKMVESIFNSEVPDDYFGNEVDAFLRPMNAPFVGGVTHQVELF